MPFFWRGFSEFAPMTLILLTEEEHKKTKTKIVIMKVRNKTSHVLHPMLGVVRGGTELVFMLKGKSVHN